MRRTPPSTSTPTDSCTHTQECETSVINIAGNLSVPGCSETGDIAKYLGPSARAQLCARRARLPYGVRYETQPLLPEPPARARRGRGYSTAKS